VSNQFFSQPPPPPRTAPEIFNAILNGLIRAVDGPRMRGALDRVLGHLILQRIVMLRQQFRRLLERIEAGTYKPRRPSEAPRRKPADPKPRQPSPLPQKSG
jgi:hypothetical protein